MGKFVNAIGSYIKNNVLSIATILATTGAVALIHRDGMVKGVRAHLVYLHDNYPEEFESIASKTNAKKK